MPFSFYDRVQSGQLISRANSDIRSVQLFLHVRAAHRAQRRQRRRGHRDDAHDQRAPHPRRPRHAALHARPRRPAAQPPLPAVVDRAGPRRRGHHHRRRERAGRTGREELRRRRHARSPSWRRRPSACGGRPSRRPTPGPGTARSWRTCPGSAWPRCCSTAASLAIDGEVSIGALVAFNAYVVLLQAPFRFLSTVLMLGQRASASADRIFEILDERSDVVDRPGAVDLVDSAGRVELDDVSFGYAGGPPVLDHFSMRGRTGRDRRPRRPHRQREVDGDPPPHALLRRRPTAACASTGTTCATSPRPASATTSGSCSTSRSCSPRRCATTSPTADPTADLADVVRGGRGGPGRRLHRPAARRLRHGHRRAGLRPVGRSAPAHRHRPHAADGAERARARRRHQRHRRARGGGHPRRADRSLAPAAPPSSSPTASPPSPSPTGSSSSRAAGSWPRAATPTSWPPSPATREVLARIEEDDLLDRDFDELPMAEAD